MDLIPRIQGILLKPKDEWEKIKGEDLPVQSLFTSYAMIVAAIPAIAQFIGNGLIGRSVLSFGWYRRPIGSALLQAVLFYIFSLVTVYVLGIIINALAPTFSSKQNQNNAMKIAVFSMTAACSNRKISLKGDFEKKTLSLTILITHTFFQGSLQALSLIPERIHSVPLFILMIITTFILSRKTTAAIISAVHSKNTKEQSINFIGNKSVRTEIYL